MYFDAANNGYDVEPNLAYELKRLLLQSKAKHKLCVLRELSFIT